MRFWRSWMIIWCQPFLGGGFKYFWTFTPIWGRFPIWLIFFKWVETTNYRWLYHVKCCQPLGHEILIFRMKPALHKPVGYCIGMYRIPRCPEESLFYNRRHASQNVSLVDVLFDLFAMTCEDQWMITSLYPHVHILKTYMSTYILYMILYPSIPQLSKLLFACFF